MITSSYRSGDGIVPGSTATIPCFVDVCSGGTVGQWYTFHAGDVVTDQLGGGRLADLVLAALANGATTVYATPATPTWAALPSVTHVGTGPTVSAALTSTASGPFDYHTIKITITQGGANGTAIMAIAYDGSTQVETLPVPVEQGANIVGTAAITADTLAKANGLTLVFIDPAVETLTFPAGSLTAAAAGLKAATATSASPVTLTASDLLTAGKAAILANPRKLRFTTAGGTASDAPATVDITGTDYAGATVTETLNLSQTAASVSSVNAYATITSLAYAAGDGTGAFVAVGYEDAYASVAELVAEVNTLAVAAPLLVTAYDSQNATAHYLGLVTQALGTSAQIELNSSSTALTLFGLTATVVTTGLAATYAPPWTGEVLTFASGTYVLGDTYTIANTGPEPSISAIVAALAIGRTNWRTTPFGFFAITAQPSSASNAAALQAACSAAVAPWRADNSCPVFCMTGSQFHTASATRATNEANILAADNAISAAFSGSTAALDMVVPGDCYVQGSAALRSGSFRRSAVFAAAVRRATLAKLGGDIAEGIVPGVSLRGPDLATWARDESSATVKLGPGAGGNSGPGFAVLKSTTAGPGSPKFAAGVTRAGSGSRYRFSYVVVVALECAQTAFARAQTWEGETWPTNPLMGAITDSQAQHKADDVYNDLLPLLLPEGQEPSVSKLSVSIDNSGRFVDTSNVPLGITFVTLGLVLDVAITVTARGTTAQSLTP